MVSGFNDLGTEVTDGIHRSVFDFELKGNSVDINKVLEDINNMGIKCSFGSVSYRQNETYDYLKRFFDDLSELPWYKENEDEEEETDEQQEHQETEQKEEPAPEPEPPKQQQPPQQQSPAESEKPADADPIPPVEEKQPENIEDRLETLLEQTYYRTDRPYRTVFLTHADEETEYKAGQQMRLNVTVCLIMYNAPSLETSFLSKMESDRNAVL